MNKKSLRIILIGLMLLALSGCSLAKEEEKSSGKAENQLIGVLITEGHMSIPTSEKVTTFEDLSKENRLYATIEKHESDSPADWEVLFKGVEGILFIVPEFRYGEEKYDAYVTAMADEEMSDVDSHFHVSDTSEKREITGTVYVKMQENKEYAYHLNPIYQTEDGEIYVTQGNGMLLVAGDQDGGLSSQKLEESVTQTVNGERIEKTTSIEVHFELMYAPVKIKVHQMDLEHKILKTDEYVPENMPEEVTLENGTGYVLVETVRKNLEGKELVGRELGMSDEEGVIRIQTFYEGNHGALRKQETSFLYY